MVFQNRSGPSSRMTPSAAPAHPRRFSESPHSPLQRQLGPKAFGIQLRSGQHRPLTERAAFLQELGEEIGRSGGGTERILFRVGWSLAWSAGRGLELSGARQAARIRFRPDHPLIYARGTKANRRTIQNLGK